MKRLLILLGLALTVACGKEGEVCFIGTGKIITEIRHPGVFADVVSYDNVDIVLVQDTLCMVSIEAGENLMGSILTEIEGDRLKLRNTSRCRWLRDFSKPVTAHIHYIKLDSLEYRSIGNISCQDTLRGDSVYIDIWEGAGEIDLCLEVYQSRISSHLGTANIQVRGSSVLSFIYLASYGPVDCANLATHITFINNKGPNDCYINVSETLGATIESKGNIYYRGNPPSVYLNRSGSGNLIKLD